MSPSPGFRGMSGAGIIVVGTLCAIGLMVFYTVCQLALRGQEVPQQLEVIAGSLLTLLPALLAKTYIDSRNAQGGDAQEVEVVNEDPVLVEEAPGAHAAPDYHHG